MGSIALFNTTANLYGTTQTTANNSTQSATTTQAAATSSDQDDTVKLSTTAQAKMLYKQGEGVSTIASALGTDTKTTVFSASRSKKLSRRRWKRRYPHKPDLGAEPE